MKNTFLVVSVIIIASMPAYVSAAWWYPATWFQGSIQSASVDYQTHGQASQPEQPTIMIDRAGSTSSPSIEASDNLSTTTDRVDALQAKIDSLSAQIIDLKARLASAQSTVSALQKNQSSCQTNHTNTVSNSNSRSGAMSSTSTKAISVVSPTTPKETKSSLLSKMDTLNTNINTILSHLTDTDPIISQLGYIQSKLGEDIKFLNYINYPTDKELADYSTAYSNLQSEFDALPPIIYSVGNMNVSISVIMSGYNFTNASYVYLEKMNPAVSDMPIKLSIFANDDHTIDLKLADVLIPSGNYHLYVVDSSGKKSTPFPLSISDTITPEHEQALSDSAPSSAQCISAQQNLKLAIDSQSVGLQQTYRTQVRFYCQ